MMLVVPANAKGPVPVLMMFGGRPVFPAPAQPSPDEMDKLNEVFKTMMVHTDPSVQSIFDKYPAYQPVTRLPSPNFFAPPKADADLTPQERLLAAGWGYCTIETNSIQADNGAGLTRGIIGLCNQGQPRKVDDWGTLRAWAWGAARGLDYLETDPLVDAHRVGIEGVSRFGKAALVTMAFEPRFAVGLIGSSGKGGTTLHRRVFGEAVENLAGSGEYHWMAGNYLKYAAEESSFGKNPVVIFLWMRMNSLHSVLPDRSLSVMAFLKKGMPNGSTRQAVIWRLLQRGPCINYLAQKTLVGPTII